MKVSSHIAISVFFMLAVVCAILNQKSEEDKRSKLMQDLSIAQDLVRQEHAARVEAEVKAARASLGEALANYNIVVSNVVCDMVRGIKDKDASSKLAAASAPLKALMSNCHTNEPFDQCVERKARESAK